MTYKAFISYSHATDRQLAPALQTGLQRIAKPFYRLRAMRIFRDETSLHLTPKLWPMIEKAISESEHFILMASPQAAASRWVQDEVDSRIRSQDGALDKFHIVLTEGDIVWDTSANDFDWEKTTALPPNLRGKFETEPLYLDFRWARKSEHLSLRNPQFLRAVGRLAAAVRDVPLDVIIGEDVRRHRIFKLVTGATIILLSALSVIASGAAYYANESRKEAITAAQNERLARVNEGLAREAERKQREQAEIARNSEKEARDVAEERRKEADKRRVEAEEQRLIAQNKTLLATKRQREAEYQQKVSLGRQLTAQAGFVGTQQARKRDLSFLLGIESMRRLDQLGIRSVEADQVLRNSLALLPQRAATPFPTLENGITDMKYSPDGKYLAVAAGSRGGGALNNVRLWNTATRREVEPLQTDDEVARLAFSKNGNYLGAVSSEGAYLWLMRDHPTLVKKFSHDDEQKVYGVGFSDNEQFLVTVGERYTACIWRTATGDKLKCLPNEVQKGDDLVIGFFNHDATKLVLLDEEGKPVVWSFASEVEPQIVSVDIPENAVALQREGEGYFAHLENGMLVVRELLSGQEFGRMQYNGESQNFLFHAQTGYLAVINNTTANILKMRKNDGSPDTRVAANINHEDGIYAVAFSPNGMYLATGSRDGTVGVWESSTGEPVARIPDRGTDGLAFSPDGRYLAAADSDHISTWDALSAPTIQHLPHSFGAKAVSSSRDKALLVIGLDSDRGTIEVWDFTTKQRVAQASLGVRVESVAISPAGSFFAAAGWYGQIKAWRVSNGGELLSDKKLYSAESLAFTPDGKYLAASSKNHVFVWEVESGREFKAIPHEDANAVVYSPNGKYLVTGGAISGAVRVFSTDGYDEIRLPIPDEGVHINSLAVSPDGNLLAIGSGSRTRIVDIKMGRVISRMEGAVNGHSITFSPDGKYVATASGDVDVQQPDYTAKIWDVSTGKEVSRLLHRNNVVSVAFSADGKFLVTNDGYVRLWFWQPRDMIEEAKAYMTRNLTCDEWKEFLGELEVYEPLRSDLPACATPRKVRK